MSIVPDVLLLASDGVTAASNGVFVTDGVTATEAVAFQPPYPAAFSSSAALAYSTVFGIDGALYATDPATGLPHQLNVANLASAPAAMVSLGADAVFAATDAYGNQALWRTDGTVGGTYELAPAGAAADFNPNSFAQIGDRAVFLGTDADGRRAVWSTDGTNAGTGVILLAGAAGLNQVQPIGVVTGRLVFSVQSGNGFSSIWSTDGTAGGTRQLNGGVNANLAANGPGALAPNGDLVFGSDQVLATDGTSIVAITQPPISGLFESESDFTAAASGVFYADQSFGRFGGPVSSLFFSNGGITSLVPIVVPGGAFANSGGGVSPTDITVFGTGVLFIGNDATTAGAARGLWFSDGTAAGTQEIAAGIDPEDIVVDGAQAFVSTGTGLYVTDGTAAGTVLSQALTPPGPGSLILDPTRVSVTGTHDEYQLAPAEDAALQLADTVPGRDGAGTFAGANIVAFSDGTGVLDPSGNAEDVSRLYEAILGRGPDLSGLIAYTNQLDDGTVTLTQIAAASVASPEFIADYGNLSDAGFIAQLYENAAGRAPDQAGLSSYLGALATGQSRGDVAVSIGESYEARQYSIGTAGSPDDAAVYRLYQAVDARAPDASGQAAYSAALASGQTVQQVAATFLAAPEYAQTFGTPDNTSFVTDLYQNLLQRAPDSAGLATYVGDLNAGTSRAAVVATFVDGSEGQMVTSQATHGGWVFVAQPA